MNYHVYVLQSREGHRYIGSTGDLEQRLADHNRGRNHSTKHGSGWQLIHRETFATRGEAVKRERWLKTGAGRQLRLCHAEEIHGRTCSTAELFPSAVAQLTM